jgi:hypothetical protein
MERLESLHHIELLLVNVVTTLLTRKRSSGKGSVN